MRYAVRWDERCEKELRRIGAAEGNQIRARLRWFAEHIDETGTEMLSGRFRGLLKLRVGNYRVAYTVDHQAGVLTVHMVGHRSDVYDIDLDPM